MVDLVLMQCNGIMIFGGLCCFPNTFNERSECEQKHLAIITAHPLHDACRTQQLYSLRNCCRKCCVTWIMWFFWHCVCLVRCCYIAIVAAMAVLCSCLNWIKGMRWHFIFIVWQRKSIFAFGPILVLDAKTAEISPSIHSFLPPVFWARTLPFGFFFCSACFAVPFSPYLSIIGSTRSGVIVRKLRLTIAVPPHESFTHTIFIRTFLLSRSHAHSHHHADCLHTARVWAWGMVNNFCGYFLFCSILSFSLFTNNHSCSFNSYLMSKTFHRNRWKILRTKFLRLWLVVVVSLKPLPLLYVPEIFDGFWNDTTSYFLLLFKGEKAKERWIQTILSSVMSSSFVRSLSLSRTFNIFYVWSLL